MGTPTHNRLTLVRLPDQMSGPRHGGPRNERRFKVYVNGFLFEKYRDGAATPFNYSRGKFLDLKIKKRMVFLETVLDCTSVTIDRSVKGYHLPDVASKSCDHVWRATPDWMIDRCVECGEERA